MATEGSDVKTLMLQVDASVELLRQNLKAAERPLDDFEKKANQTGNNVNRAFQRMGQNVTVSSGQMRSGMQQMSYQLNDMATMFAMGAKPMQIFASQSGQVVQSIQMMTGGTSKFAAFMGGPWGMAITTAAVVMTPFIAKMLDGTSAAEANAKAMDGVKMASSGLSDAQSVLGQMYDLTTGKIKDQNAMLRLNAQIMAVKLRADAAGKEASASSVFGKAAVGSRTVGSQVLGTLTFDSTHESEVNSRRARALAQTTKQFQSGVTSPETAIKWAEKFNFDGLRITREEFIQAISDGFSASGQRQIAGAIDSTLASGKLDPSLRRTDSPSRRRGPSAETLAKRAESARVADLNADTSYTNEERAARRALIDAMMKSTVSEQLRDDLLREEINAEAASRKKAIANDLSAKKIDDEKAAHLTDLAEQTRLQKLANVDLARRVDSIRDAAVVQSRDYDSQIAMLQLQDGLATTTKQRLAIQLKILELEKERLIAEQQAIIDDPTSTLENAIDAMGRQQDINKQYPLKKAAVEQDNLSPMEEYKRRLHQNTDDMSKSLEQVKVRGFESLEDGILGAISGTQSLADAFGSMANQIIADLARIAIEKMFVSLLGGGPLGFLKFAEGGEVAKKASGGFISGAGGPTSDSIPAWLSNGEYVMRADAVKRIGVQTLDAMNAGKTSGGLISGAGGSTSDSIPAWLSNGEYVMRAAAVKQIGVQALDAMNAGKAMRFAEGGLVAPRMPRLGSFTANDNAGISIPITINAPGATAETVSMIRREIANAAPTIMQAASSMTTRQMNRRRL